MTIPTLSAEEQRVIGSLLEKQITVPATYPLTLKALRTACNQTSSREPVVDYAEAQVDATARALRDRHLIRFVWAPGSRTVKYHQMLTEQIELDDDARALLTVLLLRGAQAPGALKTRTERLHVFADRSEVEACLASLAALDPPLVQELPLRPREQDRRWIHLLGPVDTGATDVADAVDRDTALAGGVAARDAAVRETYDAVAVAYADTFGDELADRPFDRWVLERVASLAAPGPLVDVGTGPGQVAAFLARTEAGLAGVHGVDVSSAMVEVATDRVPDVTFEVADFRRLLRPRTAPGWRGVTAWYALVHLTESELPDAISALAGTLDPGGWLALADHCGPETRHVEEFLGHPVSIDFVLHDPAAVLDAVRAAGLTVEEWYERSPLDGEVATTRLYVLARK